MFRKKISVLQSNILCILGYLPLSPHKKNVIKISDKMYSDIHFNINNLYEEFKKIKFNKPEFILYNSLFRLVQAKQFALFGDFEKAQQFLKEVTKALINERELWSESTFKWFNLNAQLLKIQIKNDIWINEIESAHTTFSELKNEKQQIIEECHAQYNKYEVNSPEHLMLSQKHLESYIELIHLQAIQEDKKLLSDNDKQQGKFLLNSVQDFFKQLSNQNDNEIMLKSLTLLEMIKLEYYIEADSKEIFNKVVEYCSLHIKMKNSDPIGYATGIYYPDLLQSFLPIGKQQSFKNYLYSFCLEVKKQPNNEIFFNLKQLENFFAEDINERLKIIELK